MELLAHLLPDTTHIQLENWLLDKTQATIRLIVSSTQAIAKCPICSLTTHRIHSRYERTLADLPWADYSITIQLRVRKFFCINNLCKRRIFTERLASVTVPWARRTLRMAHSIKSLPKVIEPNILSLTPRRAAWLVLRSFESRSANDEKLITLLMAQHPNLAEAMELSTSFGQLVRQRQPEQLDSWLAQANCSTLSPFRRFAKSLREDYDAVKAGVTLSISNGPVEGHINRLKMLKRQMYGRAKLDLLERRFLLAT